MTDQSTAAEIQSQSLSALIAFSAAQSFAVGSSNPLDVVIPLFQPIATQRHGKVFSAEELASDIYERYDLIVSEETCKYWGQELARRGMIVPADTADLSGAHVWRQSNNVSAPEGSFSGELDGIATAFRQFLGRNSDLFSSSYADEKIFDLLQKGAVGSLFPRLYESTGGYRSDEQYVFSRFVESLHGSNAGVLDSIVRLRRAAIFCDLILHMRAPKPPPKSPQPISVYIDSPLVMDIIGLSGKARQQFSLRLLHGFAKLSFTPMINPDMIFEVRNNIKALLKTEPARRFGPTADAIRRKDLSLSFVEAALDRVEPMVQDAGIVIDRNFPSHANRSLVSDELEQALFSKLQSHYNSLDAASRDAKTVRGVLGRRGETRPLDMYSARAFFLTGNDMVAAISNRFFRENIGYSDRNFPVVVGRSTAAALTDAIVGVESGGNLSLQDLLISAADVTQYDPTVLVAIEDKLRAFNAEEADDLVSLLASVDYSQLTMDMMKGNTKNVTVESVTHLVANVKSKLEDAAERKVATGRARERKRATAITESLTQKVEEHQLALSDAIAALGAQHDLVRGLVGTWVGQAKQRLSRYQVLMSCASLAFGIALAVVAYISIDRTEWLEANPLLKLAVAIITGLVTGLPFVGVPSFRNAITSRLAKREWVSLRQKVGQLGYDLRTDGAPDTEVLSDIDKQFNQKVAQLTVAAPRDRLLE